MVYLDDSGTHEPSPIMTMAGYVFADEGRERFEADGSAYLRDECVSVFHAKDFDRRKSKSPFAGWGLAKQLAFAEGWFSIARRHSLRGLTVSLPKARYEQRRREYDKNHNISVYCQCFKGILMPALQLVPRLKYREDVRRQTGCASPAWAG